MPKPSSADQKETFKHLHQLCNTPAETSGKVEAIACANDWTRNGGLHAALLAIRSEDPESKLTAMKSLGILAATPTTEENLRIPLDVIASLQVARCSVFKPRHQTCLASVEG